MIVDYNSIYHDLVCTIKTTLLPLHVLVSNLFKKSSSTISSNTISDRVCQSEAFVVIYLHNFNINPWY